jgi:polar amino acid transport system substrate-binding protein
MTIDLWLNVHVTIKMTMMINFGSTIILRKWAFTLIKLLFSLVLALGLSFPVYADNAAPTIILVGEDDWYPYSAYKNGKLQGLAVDLIEAAYAEVNVKVQFKTASYLRCMMLAESGQELGCFDSLKESKLLKTHLFHHESIFKAEIGIYARASSKENNIKPRDLRDKHVGVTHGYTYSDEIDGTQLIRREVAPTDLSNLRKLLIDRSEYSLVYTRVVDYLVAKYPAEFKDKIRQVGSLNQSELYLSFSKHRPEAKKFANLLDLGLRKIKKNGVYAQIEQKWRTPAP